MEEIDSKTEVSTLPLTDWIEQELVKHEIVNNLPLESALRIIDELYIVTPIMES